MYFIVRAQNHTQIIQIQVLYILSRPHLPRFQSLVPCILVVTLINCLTQMLKQMLAQAPFQVMAEQQNVPHPNDICGSLG